MEEALITHLHQHFKQAYSTPAGSTTFIQEFGLQGTNQNADTVYQGEYQIKDSLDKYSKILIKELGNPLDTNHEVFPAAISQREFQTAWRAAKEKNNRKPP